MIKRDKLFSCRNMKLFILLLLLSGTCAGCLGKDPVEARVDKLIKNLGDKDMNVSYPSYEAICEIGKPAVDPLIKALKDDNPSVRSSAASALGTIGDPKATDPLIKALKDNDRGVRIAAARALGELNDKRAVEPLIESLKDKDPEVRVYVAESLGYLKAQKAVEPLIELLKDENETVVYGAVISLGQLKDSRATEPICEVMSRYIISPGTTFMVSSTNPGIPEISGNPDILGGAVTALGEIGDPRAIDTLLGLLADKEHGPSVAETLGSFKSEYVFGKITKLLDSKNPITRTNAIAVFEYIQDPAAVPYLIKMLDDEVPGVRRETASALGFFKKPEEIARTEQPLINALGDSKPEVQEAAAHSLGIIGSKKAIPPLEGLLGSKNQNLQIAAIDALKGIKDPETVDFLIANLGREDWFVRKDLVETLTEIGGSKAVDPLISSLGDEYHQVRRSAANGLGKLGDRKAVGPLLKALETEREEEVRISEVQALGILGGPDAVKGLRRISTDKEEYKAVRTNAEKSLVVLKGGGTVNASFF